MLPFIALGLLAVALVLYHTRYGPGSSGDSTSYLMGAENILAGRGYARYSGGYEIVPITGFPPGYSSALAFLGLTGFDLWSIARWLNASLFALNVFLVGFLVYRFSGYLLAGVVASMLLMLYDVQVGLHSWIMSEPLYTSLMLTTTLAIIQHIRKGSWPYLILSGLLVASATLTRYVGASLLAGAVAVILLMGKGRLRDRFLRVGILTVLAAAPVIFWLRRNAALADTLVNREFNLHAIRPDLLRLYAAEITSWIVPHEVPLPSGIRALLAIAILVSLGATFLWLYGKYAVSWESARPRLDIREKQAHWHSGIWFLAVTSIAYLAILAANSLFLDAATTFAAPPRYLAPFYAASIVLLIGAAGWSIRVLHPNKRVLVLGGLLPSVLLGFHVSNTFGLLSDPLESLGYTGYRYRWDGVRTQLEAIPGEVPIISNNPEIVYALVDRPAYARPIRFDPYQQQEREDLDEQFQLARDRVEAGGVLVVFKPVEEIDNAVIEALGLSLTEEYPQANFYQLAGGNSLPWQFEGGVARTGRAPAIRIWSETGGS